MTSLLLAAALLGVGAVAHAEDGDTAAHLKSRDELRARLPALSSTARGPALVAIADDEQWLGDWTRSIATLGEAVDAYIAAKDRSGELAARMALADAYTTHSLEPEHARDQWLRAARIAEDIGDKDALAAVRERLSGWAVRSSEAADLLPLYKRAIDLYPYREDLTDDGGTLFVGPDNRLWMNRKSLARYDGSFLERLPLPGDPWVRSAFFGPDGLVLGTPAGVLVRAGVTWRRLPVDDTDGVVAPDPNGGLWIGVEGGAVRYVEGTGVAERLDIDASNGSDEVMGITADATGRRFVVSRAGVDVFDSAGKHVLKGTTDIPDDARSVVVDTDGTAWILATDGAVRWADGRVEPGFNPEDLTGNPGVRSFLRVSDDVLWMGLGRGLARFEHGAPHVFRERSDRFEQVYGLADYAGAVWFLNQQGEVGRIAEPWLTVHDRRLLPSGWIYSVLPQPDGALRIATGSGIVRFDPHTYDTTYWMDNAHCYGVAVDAVPLANGWAEASDEMQCLVIMDGDRTTTFLPGSGMPDGAVPSALALVGSDVCLGTDRGVWCATEANGAWTLGQPPRFAFLNGRKIVSMVGRPDGTLFVSTEALAWRVPTAGPAEVAHLGGADPRWLDTGKELLLSTKAGVARRLDDGTFAPLSGVPALSAQRALRTSTGLLLLAVPGQGLVVSDGSDWIALGVADGLPSQEIYALAEDPSGMLWAGTGGSGLAGFRWPHGSSDSASGGAGTTGGEPPETMIVARDRAWFTDTLGVPRAIGVRSLRGPTGGSSDPGTAPAGKSWLETTAGVFEIPASASLPLPGDGGHGWPGVSLVARTVPVAPVDPVAYTTDEVTFELAAITPFRSDRREDHLYQWRLDGGEWHAARHETTLVLDHLAEGAHDLEVVAKGRWLQADATPARLRFVVATPWPLWTWPAAGGAVAFVLASQRRRMQRAWLRLRHLRYRPIPDHLFEPSGPISKRTALIGREPVLQAIAERAARAPRQGASILLWADPQAGLTSVLRCVEGGKKDIVVYADLASASGTGAFAILQVIGQAATDGIAARTGGQVPVVDDSEARTPYVVATGESTQKSPYRPFERLVIAARKVSPDGALVLLIDNGDRLLQVVAEDEVHGTYLLPFLKHLVASTPGLLLCIGLSGDRGDRMRQAEDLVAISTLLPLGPLGPEAIRRLFATRSGGRLVVSPEAAQRAFDQTGGHPRLIEAVGRALAADMAAMRRNVVTLGDIDGAATRATLVDVVFTSIWGVLPVRSRLTLSLLAEGPPTTVAVLGELAKEKNAPILDEELRRVVTDLLADHRVVEKHGRVAFASLLFRDFVVRNHSLAIELEKNRDQIGSYQLLETLGEGGMGVVYRARDLVTGRICALKLMAKHLAANVSARRRFLREANLLMQMRHPNIVRILARGEHDGHAYMALELLEGESLKKVIRREGSVPWRQALLIARDMAAALEEVHGIGVVHRDVKSDNVMLAGPDRVPKLTDFGIAFGTEYTSLTQTGMLIGTYSYMAPEQVMGGEPQPSWDLYALGAMLYEMLTGELPFTGFGTMALLRAICFEPVAAPSSRRPFIPEPVDELVLKLLTKAPEDRFLDAAAVKKALEELLG